jgi:NOL1/NOP2/fmu family ribosome biogenesis protein
MLRPEEKATPRPRFQWGTLLAPSLLQRVILDQETYGRAVDGKQASPKTGGGGGEALLLDKSEGLGFSKTDGLADVDTLLCYNFRY